MRFKSYFLTFFYVAVYLSSSILLTRSTPILRAPELVHDVSVVNSSLMGKLETVGGHDESLISPETDTVAPSGHVRSSHFDSDTLNIFPRNPKKLVLALDDSNGRKMKSCSLGTGVGGWQGIPNSILIPDSKDDVTQEDQDKMVEFLNEIMGILNEAKLKPPLGNPVRLSTRRDDFVKVKSVLRTKNGFTMIPRHNQPYPPDPPTPDPLSHNPHQSVPSTLRYQGDQHYAQQSSTDYNEQDGSHGAAQFYHGGTMPPNPTWKLPALDGVHHLPPLRNMGTPNQNIPALEPFLLHSEVPDKGQVSRSSDPRNKAPKGWNP